MISVTLTPNRNPWLRHGALGALLCVIGGIRAVLADPGERIASQAPGAQAAPQLAARPFLWVRDSDRAGILAKIRDHEWAKKQFEALQARARAAVAAHRAGPAAYVLRLPWIEQPGSSHPTFLRIAEDMAATGRAQVQTRLQEVLGQAIDCGVLYYLTGDRDYAGTAGDTLQAIVRALRGIAPSRDAGNGGWLYEKDHLYEARSIGAQIPILYDFVADYLRETGTTVLDIPTGGRVRFAFDEAQEVFRTYARLAVEHGMSGSNWPVLEMPSLTHNALALDDPAERARWLAYVTHIDAPRQDPLEVVLRHLEKAGGVWPESFNYAGDVAGKLTYIVALLRRQSPPHPLPPGVLAIPRALLRIREFRFPNGESVRFGDGMRRSSPPHASLELAYVLSQREGLADGMREYGGILADAILSGAHDRSRVGPALAGPNVYLSPLSLLWWSPEVAVPPIAPPTPRVTDHLPFAGLVVQRNLASNGDPRGGLMAAVAGGSFIHSHASGMALELYGLGKVLGANAGKGTYRSDEHENYRRLFAAANTVIVNGSAQTAGGWANLGTDLVRPTGMEPAVGAPAVSPNHSFTVTHFQQNHGAATPAEQERLVAIVRTSDVGGFYVDVFRSRALVPGEQFHDYLHHNLGNELKVEVAGTALAMQEQPLRFQPIEGAKWRQNASFLHPGWHHFRGVRASAAVATDVIAEFLVRDLEPAPGQMRLHVPGVAPREYATALAPETKESGSYERKPTPVLVVRQHGEAWNRPFAVILEPVGAGATDRIVHTKQLTQGDLFAGFSVRASAGGKAVDHLVVIPPDPRAAFSDRALGLRFTGRYAVVATDESGALLEAYVGEGTDFECGGHRLASRNGAPFAAWLNLRDQKPVVQDRGEVVYTSPRASR